MAYARISTTGVLVDKWGHTLGKVQDLPKKFGRHNFVKGTASVGDGVLYCGGKRAMNTLTYATEDFEYTSQRGERITAVFAQDNWDDDTGGYAEIIKGGIGETHVTVRVTSKLMRGFDFTVFVYGK